MVCAAAGDERPMVVGVTLGRQPIETKGAAGILSPGEDRDPMVDTSVVAALGVRAVVDLIGSVVRSTTPSS